MVQGEDETHGVARGRQVKVALLVFGLSGCLLSFGLATGFAARLITAAAGVLLLAFLFEALGWDRRLYVGALLGGLALSVLAIVTASGSTDSIVSAVVLVLLAIAFLIDEIPHVSRRIRARVPTVRPRGAVSSRLGAKQRLGLYVVAGTSGIAAVAVFVAWWIVENPWLLVATFAAVTAFAEALAQIHNRERNHPRR
jgi:hypothetical protein